MTWLDSIAETRGPVGIVGAGLMGLGIAQAVAAAGFKVVLGTRNTDRALEAMERLRASVERQRAHGRLKAEECDRILGSIAPALSNVEDLSRCRLVIESVPEDRSTKEQVLRLIEAAVAREAVIATNTSGLAVSGLAGALQHQSRFMGLHFFSPAERMRLVEVVRGTETAEVTVQSGLAFVRAIGKVPVLVRDGPSFFTTRVFAAYLDEAVAMLREGVEAERIERAAIANGRAIGPLAVLDETGIELNLQQAAQAKADGLQARFCRILAEPVFRRLVEAGRGGRRRGGGFYDWPLDGQRALWPGLGDCYPPAVSQPDSRSLGIRLLAAEARETLRCLEEGIIESADDADAASILGLGFPKALGGIARWTEAYGLSEFVDLCRQLAASHGERFAPTPWLCGLASSGMGLSQYRKKEFQRDGTTQGVSGRRDGRDRPGAVRLCAIGRSWCGCVADRPDHQAGRGAGASTTIRLLQPQQALNRS
jgi:3-hydroxyacyl-CoA dehydrogenase/enoyl-CoA hydratase/3-hydroxybutyryl-CoA epimerase